MSTVASYRCDTSLETGIRCGSTMGALCSEISLPLRWLDRRKLESSGFLFFFRFTRFGNCFLRRGLLNNSSYHLPCSKKYGTIVYLPVNRLTKKQFPSDEREGTGIWLEGRTLQGQLRLTSHFLLALALLSASFWSERYSRSKSNRFRLWPLSARTTWVVVYGSEMPR